MGFWKRLFGNKENDDAERQSSQPQMPDLEERVNAIATVMGYEQDGLLDYIKSDSGNIIGFWLGKPLDNKALLSFLKAAAIKAKVDEPIWLSICLEDYRIISNTFDNRGGQYIMIGADRAAGEQIPSLESTHWRKGEPNPKSNNVKFTSETKGIKFLCPTCQLPNYSYNSDIDDYVGSMVLCKHCGNISHVPGECKTIKDERLLNVYGFVFVPIKEFSDWFLKHPFFNYKNAEAYGSYGLWAYCASCKHEFVRSVLSQYPVVAATSGVFNAKSDASGEDMQGLLKGSCPKCHHTNLVALLIDIPKYIR